MIPIFFLMIKWWSDDNVMTFHYFPSNLYRVTVTLHRYIAMLPTTFAVESVGSLTGVFRCFTAIPGAIISQPRDPRRRRRRYTSTGKPDERRKGYQAWRHLWSCRYRTGSRYAISSDAVGVSRRMRWAWPRAINSSS